MKKLFVAPWVGELGWELFGWQGYLRRLVKIKEYSEVAVCCRLGHEILYKDFCNKFIFYVPVTGETDMWLCYGDNSRRMFALLDEMGKWLGGCDVISPANFGNAEQAFVSYGKMSSEMRYDILYHARDTDKRRTGIRNWGEKNWNELLIGFPELKVGAIGTKEDALHIEGTDDFRGIPLSKLADLMVGSSVLVGGSSGPIHFGSLCKIPHVVWAGAVHCRPRYEKAWNPFNTPVNFVADTWDPSVDTVRKAIEEMLKEKPFIKEIIDLEKGVNL